MAYKQINISSGHSINCQGASGYVNEVAEARKVVDRVYEMCKAVGIEVYKYHDTASSSSHLSSSINLFNVSFAPLHASKFLKFISLDIFIKPPF